MAKNKHHYVPQFYLRAFSSNPPRQTQIHLYNLERRRAIENVSLQDQCYKNRLHGETNDLEDVIAKLETVFGVVLQKIVSTSNLPEPLSADHGLLYTFVALQMLRTVRAGELINTGLDKMIKQAYHDDSRLKDMDLDQIRVGYENPVLASLSMLHTMMDCIADLDMHLLCAGEGQTFITSDNPIYKYNQYMEGIKGTGVTGTLSTGLQIFVPLSPKHLLMLYDGRIYQVGSPKNLLVTKKLENSDVTKLNRLQVHSADQNLYFNDWNHESFVEYVVRKSIGQRLADPVEVEELVDPTNDRHVLIHQYHRMPNLMLRLSFLTFRPEAKKVPIQTRVHPSYSMRRDPSEIATEPPAGPPIPSGTIFVPVADCRNTGRSRATVDNVDLTQTKLTN